MQRKSLTLALSLSLALGATFVSAPAAAETAACTVAMPAASCEQIKAYVKKMYVPTKANNYSRHRSFLNMEANKLRNAGKVAYEYEDHSALAYGQGQLWLALPQNKREEALTIKPDAIQDWLLTNAPADKKAIVLRDVAAFNKLDDKHKPMWMAMRRSDRIAAAMITDKAALQAEIDRRGAPFNFSPYKYGPEAMLKQWKLFD